MSGRSAAWLPALIMIVLWCGAPSWAEPAASRPLSGVITDSLGRPVADVNLEIVDSAGTVVGHARSDKKGVFNLVLTAGGVYTLNLSKAGYKTAAETVTWSPESESQHLSLVLAAEEEELVVHASRVGSGPSVSPSGSSQYSVTAQDIANKPLGDNTAITDVLAQMPGVAIDQNQQIHIRNTEGPQFQYQINGVMLPLDINTNPPFISMLNPAFVKQMDLLTGTLPSRYSYATGGVVDIQTRQGNDPPGGSVSLMAGQRGTLEPSFQYGGGNDKFNYYVSGLFDQANTAFSSATPGPNAIHNETNTLQGFGYFSYALDRTTRLSLITAMTNSRNQLPNVPGLTPQYAFAGVAPASSASINSYLNFNDFLGILSLNGTPNDHLKWQVACTNHTISTKFNPDKAGELVYQGVSSTASHQDYDNSLEGDISYKFKQNTLSGGFYIGKYYVVAADASLVFPANALGQTSTTPIQVNTGARANNMLSGIYLNDLWDLGSRWRLNVGIRGDSLTGFTRSSQVDPTINLSYRPDDDSTLHAGFARYFQVPSFQGISPDTSTAFAGTSGAAGPPGVPIPVTEDDREFDVGMVHRIDAHVTVSEDNYYRKTDNYLDTGQFGVVPIFAPFNYDRGLIYGSELAVTYREDPISAYANLTVGQNFQRGIQTGQFNFDPTELAYIDKNGLVLDHQPQVGASGGLTCTVKPWVFSLDAVYSSGLRAGFADEVKLPPVFQVNLGIQRTFGTVTNRLTILNLFDATNLIRPSTGIGIFQAAYGPRFTLLDTLTVPLP